MVRVTFSELRNNARRFFDLVEQGEVIEVYRRGKPVAILSPVGHHRTDRWKRARPVDLGGPSLSRAILSTRREGR